MKIVKKIPEMQGIVEGLRRKEKSIGFVPTMGALHEGHLSLIRKARKQNDIVVVSILVNPAQFGPREDYRGYPRNVRRDAGLCRNEGVNVVFDPSVKEMYPKDCTAYVEIDGYLAKILEGKSRPGHFRGVMTIVAKLFGIVQPDRAYFGEKDYQQQLVVKKMVSDLNLPVKIISCSLIRGKDGLAMSSRNVYLDPEQRKTALVLNETLEKARHVAMHHGIRDAEKLAGSIRSAVNSQPGIKLDYVAICDGKTLKPVKKIKKGCVILIAARVGKTRLIDNVIVR